MMVMKMMKLILSVVKQECEAILPNGEEDSTGGSS